LLSTTGYGDPVLPEDWRLVGGVEAMPVIPMRGWSTGFCVEIVSRTCESSQPPKRT
jgi:hypothetical protein